MWFLFAMRPALKRPASARSTVPATHTSETKIKCAAEAVKRTQHLKRYNETKARSSAATQIVQFGQQIGGFSVACINNLYKQDQGWHADCHRAAKSVLMCDGKRTHCLLCASSHYPAKVQDAKTTPLCGCSVCDVGMVVVDRQVQRVQVSWNTKLAETHLPNTAQTMAAT